MIKSTSTHIFKKYKFGCVLFKKDQKVTENVFKTSFSASFIELFILNEEPFSLIIFFVRNVLSVNNNYLLFKFLSNT